MDTIREYIESVFAQLPRTDEMKRLKQEILANMEEKYIELTAQGIPENEAIGTVLTEFGNIDEIVEEYEIEKEQFPEEDAILFSDEEADDFLAHRIRFGMGIATGVFLCVMAPAVMLLFQQLSKTFPIISDWPQRMTDILSLVPLFFMIALGVGLFILSGSKEEQYGLDKQVLTLEPSTRIRLTREFDQFKSKFAKAIAAGVILCILAPITLLLSIVFLGEDNMLSVVFLLGFVSIGVFLFIFYGIQNATYQKLLGIGDYTPEKIRAEKLSDVVASIVFPLATLIFLIAGFVYDAWGTAWIIFPIVGILFGIFNGAYEGYLTMKKRRTR